MAATAMRLRRFRALPRALPNFLMAFFIADLKQVSWHDPR
jgi:hypothetical protein